MKTKWQNIIKCWIESTILTSEEKESLKVELTKSTTNLHLAKKLEEAFTGELEFGTAGLRGIVGLGSNRMNIYNIRRATKALAMAVKHENPIGPWKICLSYDSRLSSDSFLEEAKEVLVNENCEVYFFSEPTPTPMLSFAVRNTKSQAGVMITASHNPKDYNGYKAYWSDGAQVNNPQDQLIMDIYRNLPPLLETNGEHSSEKMANLAQKMPENIIEEYDKLLIQKIVNPNIFKGISSQPFKLIYSALHGTGSNAISRIFKKLQMEDSLIFVEEQKYPDGNFPTTDYPNPEDPKALRLLGEYMTRYNAPLGIASDPDADRMGVITRDNKNELYFLNGNEMANLLLYYKLIHLKKNPIKFYVLKSIVTSPLQNKMCQAFNVEIIETLTGFKWMSQKIRELELNVPNFTNDNFLFASEESFGCMPNGEVRDKDGISSALLFTEMTLYFQQKSKSLLDVLNTIYERFGLYQEKVLSFDFAGIAGKEIITKLVEDFSVESKYQHLPKKYLPVTIEDFRRGTRLPKASMIKVSFANGEQLFLRPSGTEPKMKFYLMLNSAENKIDEIKKSELIFTELIKKAIETLQ